MLNINYKQLTVPQLEQITVEIMDKIESGDYDALQCYALGNFLQKLGKAIQDNTYSRAYDEAASYDKDNQSAFGVDFKFSNTAATYNWDEDIEVKKLNTSLKLRKDLIKTAIKAHEKGATIVDDNGAVVDPVSMKSPSKQTITINLQK